jgi:cytidylate kinase
MIFCIFGRSCIGKTTVAKRVADELDLPLRSCGSAVQERARALGLSSRDLPDAIHRQVDGSTVVWGLANQPCIIEGRFLDAVFAGVDAPILLINLTASDVQRHARGYVSKGPSFTLNGLRQADADDASFRVRMFTASAEIIPGLTVDSSEMTVEECVLCVRTIIEARLPPHA